MPALFPRRGSPVEGGLLPQLMLALCLCNPPPVSMPFCHCWVRVGLLLSVLLLWVLGSGGGVGKKSIAMTLCRAVLLVLRCSTVVDCALYRSQCRSLPDGACERPHHHHNTTTEGKECGWY